MGELICIPIIAIMTIVVRGSRKVVGSLIGQHRADIILEKHRRKNDDRSK